MKSILQRALLVAGITIAAGCSQKPGEKSPVNPPDPSPAPVQPQADVSDADTYLVVGKREGIRTREYRKDEVDICVWHEIVTLKHVRTQESIQVEYPILPYLDSRDELLHRLQPGDRIKIIIEKVHYAREGIIDLHGSSVDTIRKV
jgi:hypothetical protein